MSTGDVGHFDAQGRLFVDGRDDEMIVSGGENVFPREVEDLLADHAEIEEAAVSASPTSEFGQRLKAFVVLRDGADADEEAGQGVRQGEPRPLQGAARGRVPRASCRATRPARSLKRELGERRLRARGERVASLRRMAAATDEFDLAGLRLSAGEGRRLELEVRDRAARCSAASATRPSPQRVPVELEVSRMTGGGYALRLRFAARRSAGRACAA